MFQHTQGRWLYLTLLLWAQPVLAFTGVSVSIDPPISTVAPDQVFNVVVQVDSIGTLCSGFENTLAWDGQLLEFVSFQPEERLAELSWAEWRPPDVYPDSVHIYILVYWFQGFLQEPGALYSFTFRALQDGETPVRFALARFGSAAGGGIQPVLTHDGSVVIADPTTDLPEPPNGRVSGLRVVPNPLTPQSRIEARLPSGEPAWIEVFDVAGRLEGRTRVVPGSGRPEDESGCSVAWSDVVFEPERNRGVHWIRLLARDGSYTTTVVGR